MGKVYSVLSNIVDSDPLLPTKIRLRDVFVPFFSLEVNCDPKFDPKLPVQSATFYPSGSNRAVILKAEEPVTGWEFDLLFRVFTHQQHDVLIYMLSNADTLLWQDVLARQHYCQTVDEISTSRLHSPGLPGEPVGWVYEVTAHMVEVARPPA